MKDSLMKHHALNISSPSGLYKALSVRNVRVLIITGFILKTSFNVKVVASESALKVVQ